MIKCGRCVNRKIDAKETEFLREPANCGARGEWITEHAGEVGECEQDLALKGIENLLVRASIMHVGLYALDPLAKPLHRSLEAIEPHCCRRICGNRA